MCVCVWLVVFTTPLPFEVDWITLRDEQIKLPRRILDVVIKLINSVDPRVMGGGGGGGKLL